MRLLVIEDAEDLAHAVRRHFADQGHAVDLAGTAAAARDYLAVTVYDAVLLDLGLPDDSGSHVLQDLRQQTPAPPVLIMSARAGLEDKLQHFALGADDYLSKPFDLRELEARLQALLRRHGGLAASVIRLGNFTFDGAAKRASVGPVGLELGRREFRLLEYFVASRNRIVSKDQILERLFSHDEEVGLNAVELYVSRLRRKLEASDFTIRTIRGLGYVAELTPPSSP